MPGETDSAEIHSGANFLYLAVRHVRTSIVCYVIFHRFLREIPPWISFCDPRVSAELTPKRGHLRGVATQDPETWGPDISKEYLPSNVPGLTGITDEDYGDSSDEEMDGWPDADGDSRDYSPEDPPLTIQTF